MRDIRFRAWETISRSMISWKELLPHIGKIFNQPKQENIILMEYTGQKDRKGKEIHEGDLLTDGERIWEIKWRSAPVGFGMFLIEKPKKEFDGRIGRFTTSLMDYQCEKLEVIGNIHDNPELLS